MIKGKFFYFFYKHTDGLLKKKGKLKIPFSSKIRQYVKSKAQTDFVKVEGSKMHLDENDSLNLSTNKFEPIETELVKKEIKLNSNVIDIGSNIGYYSLLFSKIVGKNGKVFSFEPEPNNFKILKKNVFVNGHENIQLENIALSNKNGTTKLFLAEKNKGMHRVYQSKLCTDDFIEVKMIKLDDYFSKNPFAEKISFIKMDVEGYEYFVLEGMTSLIAKNKNLKILLEFIPASIKESNSDPKKLLDFLEINGFKIYNINKEKNLLEEVSNKDELIKTYDDELHETSKGTNLFCVKN